VRRSVPYRSLSSTSYQTNKYSGLTCGGLPIASDPGQGGCLNQSAPFFKVSCVTTTDDFPFEIYYNNSLVLRSFAPGMTCAAPGLPTSVTVIPLDTCVKVGTGSQKYSCSATTGLSRLVTYTAADCSGTGELSVQAVNTCGKDSSDPSPIDVSCSATAYTPVITEPSSAFLPPPISGSGELPACTDKASRSSEGADEIVCGSVEKYADLSPAAPTFGVVVFNPFGRSVAINQLAVTACSAGSCVTKSLPSSEVVLGKNAIVSRNMWIALKNVKCATPSNPFAYCAVSITDTAPVSRPHYYCKMRLLRRARGMNGGSAHFAPHAKRRWNERRPRTFHTHAPYIALLFHLADWFREDTQLGAIVAAVAVVVVAGALIGVICACCGLFAVLHVFGCVVCPCFNCCCDRRKRSAGGADKSTFSASAPSYPISVQSSNPAAMGVAYGAQPYAPTQPQLQQPQPHQYAPAPNSLTAKWDTNARRV
jgi:hypothetical protein